MKRKIILRGMLILLLSLYACKQPTCPFPEGCDNLLLPAEQADVQNADLERLKGADAGLPLSAMPGIKTMTTRELTDLGKEPETGLFLLDMDYIPQELAEDLKTEGYSLSEDGTIDSAGVPVTLFVKGEVFKVEYDRKDPEPEVSDGGIAKAFPLPWVAYSYYWWWKYEGGFCRKYKARTRAYAYGPRVGDTWPYTNIQMIQTRAYISSGNKSDVDVCFNCFQEESYVSNTIGCFWPAHGNGYGSHYIYLYDKGASVYRSWGWSN